MATYGWPDAQPIILDGYDFGGTGATTMTITIPGISKPVEDVTGAGSTWEQYLQLPDRKATGNVDFTLLYDPTATTGTDAALIANSAIRTFVIGFEGGTAGTRFAGGVGFQPDYTRTPTKGALLKAAGMILVSSQYDSDGIILKAKSAVTTDGDTESTSIDNGAATSNGGAAYYQVTNLALHTATNLAMLIRESVDNITFTNLAAAAVVTAHPDAEQVVVTGTVKRYLAAKWSWTGGAGASSTATIFVGFARR